MCAIPAILVALLAPPLPVFASDSPPEAASYDALAKTQLERAQAELSTVESLVAEGTLPKMKLTEARDRVADAQDELVLSRTLYGQARLQDMTPADAKLMLEASRSRVEREQKVVDSRRSLVSAGIMAQSEFQAFADELEARKRVLELAQNRVSLLDEIRQMAEAEERLERAAHANALKDVMIRYLGSGSFSLSELPTISKQFEQEFHRPLPVSAVGETTLHRSLGLDHRNRVDVALNPDAPEGLWLRQLLERLRIPYLAFRSAVAGAATAPHIHIGTGSSRLAGLNAAER